MVTSLVVALLRYGNFSCVRLVLVLLALWLCPALSNLRCDYLPPICTYAHARRCVYVHVCVCAQVCGCGCGCCFGGADGCIALTMLVDVCQCCCLLMFVCLPLSRDTFLVVKLGE